jgi:hypothetical protein
LEQDPLEGVLAVEMLAASFGPEVVEQKAPEDVEWLSLIDEAARVIAVIEFQEIHVMGHKLTMGCTMWRCVD